MRGEPAEAQRLSVLVGLRPVLSVHSLSLLIIPYPDLTLSRVSLVPPSPVFSLSRTLRILYEQLVVSQYRDIVAGASSVSLPPPLLPFSLSLSFSPVLSATTLLNFVQFFFPR